MVLSGFWRRPHAAPKVGHGGEFSRPRFPAAAACVPWAHCVTVAWVTHLTQGAGPHPGHPVVPPSLGWSNNSVLIIALIGHLLSAGHSSKWPGPPPHQSLRKLPQESHSAGRSLDRNSASLLRALLLSAEPHWIPGGVLSWTLSLANPGGSLGEWVLSLAVAGTPKCRPGAAAHLAFSSWSRRPL